MRHPLSFGALLLTLAASPALAQDAGELVLRLNRIEGQFRQVQGQVEQLQHENRQLKEQVRRFQEDVEFRLQERGGASRPSQTSSTSSTTPAAQPAPVAAAPGASAQAGVPQVAPVRPGGRRGDAFDPSANPNAPGAPRPLGGAPSEPGRAASAVEDDVPGGSGPLNLGEVGRPASAPPQQASGSPAPPSPPQRVSGMNPGGFGGAPGAPASPSAPATSPTRAEYDAALAHLQQKQYEQAEIALRGFLQSHPRDRLVPDAVYHLGESYLYRGRHREAAEQFLKVSTDHARSAKAPDAMLKLGVSLNALGARDQACATFAELERKFPQAAPGVKQGVDREQKRARCAA